MLHCVEGVIDLDEIVPTRSNKVSPRTLQTAVVRWGRADRQLRYFELPFRWTWDACYRNTSPGHYSTRADSFQDWRSILLITIR